MGRKLRNTFNNVSAVFSPACIAHEVLTKQHWTQVSVDGVTLPDALECWANSLPKLDGLAQKTFLERQDNEVVVPIRIHR